MALTVPFRPEKNSPASSPLAPIIDIVLRHKGKSRAFAALIDTGAAFSTISAKALAFFQPQKSGQKRARSAMDSPAADFDFYRMDELHFVGQIYKNHPLFFVTSRDEEMLIGRDILKFHQSLFDGPAEEITIE